MMEKFDGVRVFWDGKSLVTSWKRKNVNVPQDILKTFPKIPFEGELWCGYMGRDQANKLVDGQHSNWDGIHIKVFDQPLEQSAEYEERLAILKKSIFDKLAVGLQYRHSLRSCHIKSVRANQVY
jgi:hypothetical protein